MKNSIINVSEIQFDDMNANRHTARGTALLESTINELGFGRSVLLDKNKKMIAGEGAAKAAIKNGMTEVILVPVKGNQIVAVQRTDIDLDSKKGRQLAIADNQTAKIGIEFDNDVLLDIADKYDVDLAAMDIHYIAPMTADDLAAFFQPNTSESKPEKCVILLEYSQEEGERVKTELLRRGNSYEQAVWTLLGLE